MRSEFAKELGRVGVFGTVDDKVKELERGITLVVSSSKRSRTES